MTNTRPSLDTLLAELLALEAVVAAFPLVDLDALLAQVSPLCTGDHVASSARSSSTRRGTRRRRRRR